MARTDSFPSGTYLAYLSFYLMTDAMDMISAGAAALAGGAALLPFLPPLAPRTAGPRLFYRLPAWQKVLVSVAAAAATASVIVRPESLIQWVALAATLSLGIHAFLYPHRILVALDFPRHSPATQAGLGNDACVLAEEIDDTACAWPLEILVPRHLINDRLGHTPVLAAY